MYGSGPFEFALALVSASLAVMAVLSSSPPRVPEHFEQPAYTGADYESYYAIVSAYRRVLERAPTEDEMQRARVRLSTDAEFDIPALETSLRASEEFRRLVGLQKNASLANVDGIVTESSLRAKISDIYSRITGQVPDEVTADFLYARYRHTNLSDAYITALIQQMATGTTDPSPVEPPPGADPNAADPNASHPSSARAGPAETAQGTGSSDTVPVSREVLRSLGLTEEEARLDPDAVAHRLREISQNMHSCSQDAETDKYRKTVCMRDRQAMLDSVGYDEGAPIGSWAMPSNGPQRAPGPSQAWTMPINRMDYERAKSRFGGRDRGSVSRDMPACPSVSHLGTGTPLVDVANQSGNMILM